MRFRDYKPVAEISLGIENEFLAEARCGAEISEASTEFIYNMAKLHNQFVPSTYPRMESQVRYGEDITSRPPRDFTCWVVETEDELGQDGDSARHGIEIKSPQLKTLHEPGWRKQIEETWAFLGKYYRISKTPACSTHIHVSIRRGGEGGIGMGLHIMKKIAQCIIHFEPAFEALVPPERRGNMWAASNWIDNRLFVGSDFTREKVIEEIDNCNSTEEVVHMMSPPPQGKLWAWNFQAMKKFGTIEFRKGSASLNSRDAIGWAELVLYFVQAAIGMESIKSMLRVPANIGSLKSFLGRQLVENNTIFEGKKDQDSVQPELIYFRHDQREILKKKLFLDEMKQANLCASKGKQKRCPKIKDRASTASPD